MFQFARKLVSQNKNRLKEDGFDLDLTYLTDQIICMGLPAHGPEALYRNPIDSVVRFLEKHHGGKYKVFNLCNERTYDITKFGDACASFPFDDHGAPPLALVIAFCRSCKSWLLQSLENVVAVHCKAGKGRTGLMACCLVMHLGYQRTANDAIVFYNNRRTKDGRGLTVPSQRRYVHYYERVLREPTCFEGCSRTLSSVRVCGVPPRHTRLLVTIHKHGAPKLEAPILVVVEIDPRLPLGAPHSARCQLTVSSDLRVDLADDTGHELCKLWMHPAMEPAEAVFVLDHDKLKSEIDVGDKGALPDGFTIAFLFEEEAHEAGAPEGSAAAASPPPESALVRGAPDGAGPPDSRAADTSVAGETSVAGDAGEAPEPATPLPLPPPATLTDEPDAEAQPPAPPPPALQRPRPERADEGALRTPHDDGRVGDDHFDDCQ